MASERQAVQIEDCMEAIIDYRGKTPKKSTSGIPLITARIIKNGRIETPFEFISEEDYPRWMTRGLPHVGDVIVTTEAPLGEIAQIEDANIALAQRVILLRGKKGLLDNTFLKFLMRSAIVQRQLQARASGTTVSGIKQSELRKVLLPLPHLAEQNAIVSILSVLDDKMEHNRKISATLESIARTLFTSWFVDFDSVQARGDSMVSSSIGAIPSGWGLSNVGQHLQTMLGGTPARSNAIFWTNGTVPWINSGKANQFRIIAPTAYITEDALKNSAAKVMPARTTVIAITGATLGQISLLEIPAAANQSVVGIVGTKTIPSEFIYLWLKSRINDLISRQTGGAQQHVNKNDVNDMALLIPPAQVMEEYVRVVRPMFDRIKMALNESSTLVTLRDTLLPKLISGELRVRDSERILEKSA